MKAAYLDKLSAADTADRRESVLGSDVRDFSPHMPQI